MKQRLIDLAGFIVIVALILSTFSFLGMLVWNVLAANIVVMSAITFLTAIKVVGLLAVTMVIWNTLKHMSAVVMLDKMAKNEEKAQKSSVFRHFM